MPWIRAITAPLDTLRSAGLSWKQLPVDDLGVVTERESDSMQLAIDFIGPDELNEAGVGVWHVPWGKNKLRISCTPCPPQIATLGWFHSY